MRLKEKANPAQMSDKQMLRAANRILTQFHRYSASDPFGCDWPTMRAVFPDQVAQFNAMRDEWKRRQTS